MTTVLVTRAEPDASRFAGRCRAAGLVPILSPVMRIGIEKAPVDLAGAGAIAFTSANGVRAFAATSPERALPVFAVGPVTAAAAKEAGFATVHVAGGDVEALADHIASESALPKKEILHIAGADRAGDLVTLLKERGVSARRQMLYRAVAQDALSVEAMAALKETSGLWVTFFSPRTAKLFLELAGKAGFAPQLSGVRAVCLSQAVAEAANAARWAEIAVALERTAEGMIETICATRRA